LTQDVDQIGKYLCKFSGFIREMAEEELGAGPGTDLHNLLEQMKNHNISLFFSD
jgi:hypothetical protein